MHLNMVEICIWKKQLTKEWAMGHWASCDNL
uniref:Uncharacterized protein n=1 Tax=Anguilla anguilla TaxID=7936 RepID=A0A0E9QJ16_ANGAN